MIDPRSGLLIAGCMLFGGIIVAEVAGGIRNDNAASAALLRRPDTAAVAPLPAANVHAVMAISLARPLFSPSRRPPMVAGGGADGVLADKRLAGIVIAPQRRIAIFEANGAKPLIVTEGEELSGWRIETIAPGRVSVSGPGGILILEPKLEDTGVTPVNVSAPHPFGPPRGAAATAKPAVPLLHRRNPG